MIGQHISHYRIVQKLGEGGMGIVYIAEDTLLGRRVAIKTLQSSPGVNNTRFRKRFLNEARVASKLSHAHIATIYDYGETESAEPYIVMELIDGKTLTDRIREETLTISEAIQIIRQVAEALSEAHRYGLVHRDIKPSNIAINDRGIVKVLDFGLAKQILVPTAEPGPSTLNQLNTQTREGVVVGTPLYLSPEQALGLKIDPRSDLFSLGSVLYESIVGEPPFAGKSEADICAKVIRDDPPPPSRLNADVPSELDRVTMRALAKKPEARYQTANEFIRDLEAIKTGQSVPYSTITRRKHGLSTRRKLSRATLSDIFKRPRLSIGNVGAGILVLALVAFGAWRLTRPKPYHPTPEAQRSYDLGTAALRSGLPFQASTAFHLALRSDDRFVLAHARLAEALMELDYVDKAKDEMLKVSQLTPDRSQLTPIDSLYLDAVTAIVRRDFTRAIEAYSELARRQPEQSLVHVDLGRAYEKNNEWEKAMASYLQAVQIDPQNPTAFLRLGILHGRQRNIAEASAAFDTADVIYQSMGIVEGRAEVALQRGVLLNDIAGKLEPARVQLEAALEMAKVVDNKSQQIRILFQLSSISFKLARSGLAQRYAQEAVEVAQANQMETLIARSFIELGNTYYVRSDYANAERNFQTGLEYARRVGARQNEARAQLSLASLYMQLGETDRALSYVVLALPFYESGGYRTEVSQALILRGRAYREKGDYKTATKSFQEQLQIAEQSGDLAQQGNSHSSLGYLLLEQERYAEALQHFTRNYEISNEMHNQLNMGYALMNRGLTYWRLGLYAESRNDLDRATDIAKRDDSSFHELQAFIGLIEAQIHFGNQDLPATIKATERALKLAGEQDKVAITRGKSLIGLSQAFAGQVRQGKKICQEAMDLANTMSDPLLVARTQLALAEVSLLAGDTQRALTNAQQAQKFFATAELPESEWRAWLIAGLVSRSTNQPDAAQSCMRRATELLASLQQKWDSRTYESYLKRPDIQKRRQQLK